MAQDAEEALQVEAQHAGKIDLLLTDVVMPGMNGRVLADKLRSKQPGLRVLYIRGYTDSFIAARVVPEPSTVLLHKPFSEESPDQEGARSTGCEKAIGERGGDGRTAQSNPDRQGLKPRN